MFEAFLYNLGAVTFAVGCTAALFKALEVLQ